MIEYLYDATGRKVRKRITEQSAVTTTDYLDGFQYGGDKIEYFPTAEGYVKNTVINDANHYNYVYNYTDHLGNVRLSYGHDPAENSTKILEESNYYPFGLKHENYNVNVEQYKNEIEGVALMPWMDEPHKYNYKFNGKELQEEKGLNLYDYGARNYDPAIGRWMNIDPLAEISRRWSPYNYVYNNPVKLIDPDGMFAMLPTDAVDGTSRTDGGKNLGGSKEDRDEEEKTKEAHTTDEGRETDPPKTTNSPPETIWEWITGMRNTLQKKDKPLIKSEFPEIVTFFIGGGEVKAVEEGIVVLGKYPEYVNLASKMKAKIFSIPVEIWNKMTKAEQWAANIKFLDRAVTRGDKIVLSNRVTNISEATGYFKKELQYLTEKGYKLAKDGLSMIKK